MDENEICGGVWTGFNWLLVEAQWRLPVPKDSWLAELLSAYQAAIFDEAILDIPSVWTKQPPPPLSIRPTICVQVYCSTTTHIFHVHGSVHRNNILIYIQQDATLHILSYLETAPHVSGGTITHHQERKQLYLQHLVFVRPLLLPAAIAVMMGGGTTRNMWSSFQIR